MSVTCRAIFRYQHDAFYHALVTQFAQMLFDDTYTPCELSEAVELADRICTERQARRWFTKDGGEA